MPADITERCAELAAQTERVELACLEVQFMILETLHQDLSMDEFSTGADPVTVLTTAHQSLDRAARTARDLHDQLVTVAETISYVASATDD